MRRVALVGLVAVAFLSLPVAADTYQPVRAVVVAVALLVVLLVAAPERVVKIPRGPAVALAVMIVGFVTAALLNQPASSVWGVHGRYQALVSFGIMVIAGLAGWYGLRDDMRWLARVAAVGAAVMGLIVLDQALFNAAPVGTIGNRALLGSWLAVTTAGALAAWRVERGRIRWAMLAAAGLGAVGMGLAGSRGAWIGLAAAVVLVVVAGGWKRSWPLVLVIALVVGGALLIGGESVTKLSPASLASGSAASRWEIWRGTGAMIADNPVVGVGPGRFLYEYPAYQTPEHVLIEAPDTRADQAHSLLLQTASEAGIPAAAAAATLVGLAMWGGYLALRRRDPAALAAGAMFVAFVGQGLFGIATIETNVLGWLVGGVLVGYLAATGPAVSRRAVVAVGGTIAGILAVASLYYIIADVRYEKGLRAFDQADFPNSLEAHESAIGMNPLVGSYRVAYSDAATFAQGDALAQADEILSRGLELEPLSYDLAFARARVRALSGASPDELVQAYLRAVDTYPYGIEVRLQAAVALAGVGRLEEAQDLARDVLIIVPEDPLALSILETPTGE